MWQHHWREWKCGMQKAVAFGAHILPYPATSFHTHIHKHSLSASLAEQQFSAWSCAITRLVAAAGLFSMIFYLTSCHSPKRSTSPVRVCSKWPGVWSGRGRPQGRCPPQHRPPPPSTSCSLERTSNSILCSRSQPEKDCSSQTHPVSGIVIAPVWVPFVCTFPLRFSRK